MRKAWVDGTMAVRRRADRDWKASMHKTKGPAVGAPRTPTTLDLDRYAVKLVPHPQPPVAFGLLNVKPLPCIAVT